MGISVLGLGLLVMLAPVAASPAVAAPVALPLMPALGALGMLFWSVAPMAM